MDQNEVTKHFSVGNTFRQTTMHARIFCISCAITWLGLWLNQDPLLIKWQKYWDLWRS